jgi:hypothetical protein
MCRGKGQVPTRKSVEVSIPEGMDSDVRLRVAGKVGLNLVLLMNLVCLDAYVCKHSLHVCKVYS